MEKIRMAILGTGKIAAVMAKTLASMELVEMYAVASRDETKARAFAGEYGFSKAYGSYEALAEDERVQLVYIATPHSEHCANAKLCLNHGKHVLCEKAFAVNERQAREMIGLAREKGLLLAEAMWVRYMPMAQTLKQVLASGVIGEAKTLTANLCYLIGHVERIRRPELAGGALLDVGVYTLTFASIAFGDEIERMDSSVIRMDTGVDAQSSVTITYRDGRMAILNSSSQVLSDRKGIIYGSRGYMIVENINNFESIQVYDTERKLVESYGRPPQISGYEYQVEACVEAIQKGLVECPEMPHSETIEIMRQMDALRGQWGLTYPME